MESTKLTLNQIQFVEVGRHNGQRTSHQWEFDSVYHLYVLFNGQGLTSQFLVFVQKGNILFRPQIPTSPTH